MKYQKEKFEDRMCEICGKTYTPVRGYQKMCSIKCRRIAGREKQRKVMENDIKNGTGNEWLKIRFMILRKDGFACKYCGRRAKDGVILEIDHIQPKSKGGLWRIDNLFTVCSECNQGKKDVILEKREIEKLQ